jgi:hypothetical protein
MALIIERSNRAWRDRTRRDRTRRDRTRRDRAGLHLQTVANQVGGRATVVAVCLAVAIHTAATPWDRAADGADAMAIIAAVGIAVSVVLWAPRVDETPARPVTTVAAIALIVATFGLFTAGRLQPSLADGLFGPMVTAGLLGAYLSCWGFRSVFLLRRVAVMSLLTWTPIAAATHAATRASIAELSDLVYRRLGTIAWYDVHDHQWRLFGAMMHRGALAALAAVLLTFASTRLRMSVAAIAGLIGAVGAALLIHHALVLAVPVDDYSPPAWARLALDPVTELAIGASCAAVLSIVAHRKGTAHVARPANVRDRDPVIFHPGARHESFAVARSLMTAVPVVLVLIAGIT